MSITIAGIRVDCLNVEIDYQTGEKKMTGKYSIISSTGNVLAKQEFNGYNTIKITWSNETVKALNGLMTLANKDIQTTLGLEEETK